MSRAVNSPLPTCFKILVPIFPMPLPSFWPKWLELAGDTSGASGCMETSARACPRSLPLCFVLRWLTRSTHGSISDFNCSTSLHHFIISSSPYTTRRAPLLISAKSSKPACGVWARRTAQLMFLDFGARQVGFGVCGLGGAGTPKAALFKLQLGLRTSSGPTKVTMGAPGLGRRMVLYFGG